MGNKASFAYFPCLVFIITILVLPVSILLAKLSCQLTAVVHGNWAVSQARAKTPYDTVEVLNLRRRLGLAFVSLTDSQGKLLISEPRDRKSVV